MNQEPAVAKVMRLKHFFGAVQMKYIKMTARGKKFISPSNLC